VCWGGSEERRKKRRGGGRERILGLTGFPFGIHSSAAAWASV